MREKLTIIVLVNHGKFMQTTSTALAAGALSSVSSQPFAQSSGELRVVVEGGEVGKAANEAYVKSFEAERSMIGF